MQEVWRIALPGWGQLEDIGLYMDQVITRMERTFDGVLPGGEITRSMVNNYVKVGLLKRPVGKKYAREHLAMLIMIVLLKQALSMECVALALDALCRDGAQAGYMRFCGEVEAICRALDAGRTPLPCEGGDAQQAAAHAAIAASIMTIRANMLLQACKPKEERGK